MMKRIIALVLLLCMVLPLCACPAQTEPGKGPGGETGAVTWPDAVGEKNYNGEELVISVMDNFEYEIFGEDESEDTLDQLLWKRDRALQERFNVSLVSAPSQSLGPTDESSHYEDVQEALMRGEQEFDVIAMFAFQSGKLITEGYYLNWRNDIPYCKDSIKAGADWWPAGINTDSTVAGAQYVAVSDLCITAIERAWCMAFNKDIAEQYNFAKTAGGTSMYDLVDRGLWTLPTLMTLTKDFKLEGTSPTDEGTYGLMVYSNTGVDAFAFSFGFHYIDNDGENYPELWVPSLSVYTAIEDLRELSQSVGCYFDTTHTYEEQTAFFAERHAVFATLTLDQFKTDIIHEMEDKYGVLPYPMLNVDQKKYLSGSKDNYSVLSVPYTAYDLDKVGAVIEALSAYNNVNVNDQYYEAIVTHKNTRDPDSVRMIDKIMEGRVYDLSTYHYNDLVISWTDSESSLGLFFRYCLKNPTADASSYWQSCTGYLPDDLLDLIQEYEELA